MRRLFYRPLPGKVPDSFQDNGLLNKVYQKYWEVFPNEQRKPELMVAGVDVTAGYKAVELMKNISPALKYLVFYPD